MAGHLHQWVVKVDHVGQEHSEQFEFRQARLFGPIAGAPLILRLSHAPAPRAGARKFARFSPNRPETLREPILQESRLSLRIGQLPVFYGRLSGDDTRRQLGQRGRRQPRLELVTMHSVSRMTLLYDQMAWNKLQDTLEHVSAGPKYEPPLIQPDSWYVPNTCSEIAGEPTSGESSVPVDRWVARSLSQYHRCPAPAHDRTRARNCQERQYPRSRSAKLTRLAGRSSAAAAGRRLMTGS